MTQPDLNFTPDPLMLAQVLTIQRNSALDEAASWRAAAVGERQRADRLASELAEAQALRLASEGTENGSPPYFAPACDPDPVQPLEILEVSDV